MSVILQFITIIAWFALVASVALLIRSCGAMYYYEFTKKGKLDQLALAVNGRHIAGYGFTKAIVLLVISTAWIVANAGWLQ